MKIVLVRPRPAPETIGLQHVMICEPLELEYLCSAIADLGHETVILDMILETAPLADLLRAQQPDVVGVTGYISHVGVVREYCREARAVAPGCRTVVGGVHAEVVPEDFVDPAIDFIVCANGLTTFRRLIMALAGGGGTADLPGLWRPGAPRRRARPASRIRGPTAPRWPATGRATTTSSTTRAR